LHDILFQVFDRIYVIYLIYYVLQLRESLERGHANETHCYSSLQTNYIQVREENLHLVNANDKLNTDLRDLQSNLRSTKTRLHALKTANDELESHIQDREGQIRAMDMEMSRLMSRNTVITKLLILLCISILVKSIVCYFYMQEIMTFVHSLLNMITFSAFTSYQLLQGIHLPFVVGQCLNAVVLCMLL